MIMGSEVYVKSIGYRFMVAAGWSAVGCEFTEALHDSLPVVGCCRVSEVHRLRETASGTVENRGEGFVQVK